MKQHEVALADLADELGSLQLLLIETTPKLRDRFAMAALDGVMRCSVFDPDEIASNAYLVADAMLKAREGK